MMLSISRAQGGHCRLLNRGGNNHYNMIVRSSSTNNQLSDLRPISEQSYSLTEKRPQNVRPLSHFYRLFTGNAGCIPIQQTSFFHARNPDELTSHQATFQATRVSIPIHHPKLAGSILTPEKPAR
jgi:hypothetical protein